MFSGGRRQAGRFCADLFVVYVEQSGLSGTERAMIERNLAVPSPVQVRIEVLPGKDVVDAILGFARRETTTKTFVGHSQRAGFFRQFRPNLVERLILESDNVDVREFSQSEAEKATIP